MLLISILFILIFYNFSFKRSKIDLKYFYIITFICVKAILHKAPKQNYGIK